MRKSDHIGFERAAAISLNYALDSVESEIQRVLSSGAEITTETLFDLLAVIKQQRITERHPAPEMLQ